MPEKQNKLSHPNHPTKTTSGNTAGGIVWNLGDHTMNPCVETWTSKWVFIQSNHPAIWKFEIQSDMDGCGTSPYLPHQTFSSLTKRTSPPGRSNARWQPEHGGKWQQGPPGPVALVRSQVSSMTMCTYICIYIYNLIYQLEICTVNQTGVSSEPNKNWRLRQLPRMLRK